MAKIATSLAGNSRSHHGFTLIEILVVLVIVAAVLTTVAPQFVSSTDTTELTGTTRQIAAALRQARSEAIASQSQVTFVVDLDQYSYQSGKHDAVEIPKAFALTLYTADSELLGVGRGAIRFYADGSSSGGHLTVASKHTTETIVVDWLTGRIASNKRTLP